MLKLTSCELVPTFFFNPPPFPFFPPPLPPRLPFFVATSGEATDRHSVFSPKARNRRCNSCWLGGLPARRKAAVRPQAALLCSATWSWSTNALEGGERAQVPTPPPTPRWVRDALGWGRPGESPEPCGSWSPVCYPRAYSSPPPSSQFTPTPHRLALGNTSASDPGWTPFGARLRNRGCAGLVACPICTVT